LLCVAKAFAALVLFAVCAANVVVGTIELPDAQTLIAHSNTAAHQSLRHIGPRGGELPGSCFLRDLLPEGGRQPCGFLGSSRELAGTGGVYFEQAQSTSNRWSSNFCGGDRSEADDCIVLHGFVTQSIKCSVISEIKEKIDGGSFADNQHSEQ
jgi:hypothetical protein